MNLHSTLAAAPEPLLRPEENRDDAGADRRAAVFRQLILLGICLAAVLATYCSALLLSYGYADDYGLLDQALPPYPHWQIFIGDAVQGRWLDGYILGIAYKNVHRLANLRYMRLISIVGLGFVAWAVHAAMRRAGWSTIASVCVGIMLCTLPAIQIYITWAAWMINPWAMLLTVIAAWIATDILDGKASPWLLPAAAALVIVPQTVYQPAEMIFVALTLIDAFAPGRPTISFWNRCRRLALFGGLEGASLVGGYIAFRAGMFFFPQYKLNGRTGFGDFSAKPRWFVEYPLTDALNLWHIPASSPAAVVVGAVIAIGLTLFLTGTWERVLGLCICAIALPAAHLPNLVSESESAYRTEAGLSWTVLILLLFAVTGICRAIERGLARWHNQRISMPRSDLQLTDPMPRGALVVLTFLSMCAAAYVSTAYITWPSALELAMLRVQLAKPEAQGVRHLLFLQMRDANDFPVPCYYEFGCPSLTYVYEWAPAGAVYYIDRETNRHAPRRHVRIVQFFTGTWTEPLRPRTAIIDMRGLGADRAKR